MSQSTFLERMKPGRLRELLGLLVITCDISRAQENDETSTPAPRESGARHHRARVLRKERRGGRDLGGGAAATNEARSKKSRER